MATDDKQVVATFKANEKSSTEIRFTLDELGGKQLAQIRTWIKTDEGKMIPTKKGVAFPRTSIDAMVNGVNALADAIKDND